MAFGFHHGWVCGRVSIFILPKQLILTAGRAIILAYAFVSGMVFITSFATLQIGAILPAEDGTFIALRKVLSPMFGFFEYGAAVVVVVNAFVSDGFAGYLK